MADAFGPKMPAARAIAAARELVRAVRSLIGCDHADAVDLEATAIALFDRPSDDARPIGWCPTCGTLLFTAGTAQPERWSSLRALLQPRAISRPPPAAALVSAARVSRDIAKLFAMGAAPTAEERAHEAAEDAHVARLETVAANDDRLAELAIVCRCGHERGDHMDEGNHACDVRTSTVDEDDGSELIEFCPCREFLAARKQECAR